MNITWFISYNHVCIYTRLKQNIIKYHNITTGPCSTLFKPFPSAMALIQQDYWNAVEEDPSVHVPPCSLGFHADSKPHASDFLGAIVLPQAYAHCPLCPTWHSVDLDNIFSWLCAGIQLFGTLCAPPVDFVGELKVSSAAQRQKITTLWNVYQFY